LPTALSASCSAEDIFSGIFYVMRVALAGGLQVFP